MLHAYHHVHSTSVAVFPIIAAAWGAVKGVGKLVGKGIAKKALSKATSGNGGKLKGLAKLFVSKKKKQEIAEAAKKADEEKIKAGKATGQLDAAIINAPIGMAPGGNPGQAPNINEFFKKYGLFIGGGLFLLVFLKVIFSSK